MDLDILKVRLRHLGPWRTALVYAGRALHRFAGITVYSVICLEPERVFTGHVDRRDLEVAEVPLSRLREEAADPGLGLPPERLAEELAKGDRCFGAFVKGVLACYTFVAEGPTVVQGDVVVTFGDAWALTRWTYARPAYRGRGLYAAAKAYALEQEQRRGRNGLLGMVAASNYESVHAAKHLGFRTVATMVVGQWGRRSVVWSSRACERFGMKLRNGAEGRALASRPA